MRTPTSEELLIGKAPGKIFEVSMRISMETPRLKRAHREIPQGDEDMIVLEPDMQFIHEHNIMKQELTIFNPWNGAVLMTIPRITEEGVTYIMGWLNTGARHIHSMWVWHGTHGEYVPVIK